jgi:phage terminase small subunit
MRKPRADLKERYERFAAAYVSNGGNAAAAARAAMGTMLRAGDTTQASVQGTHLLKTIYVQHLIAEHHRRVEAELKAKYEITRENVLDALSNLVFADPRLLFNPDGTLKHVSELDDRTAKMVSSFEVEELYEVEGKGPARRKVNTGRVTKVKMWDKNSAVDKAMRHLGLFEKDNNQKPTPVILSKDDAGVL